MLYETNCLCGHFLLLVVRIGKREEEVNGLALLGPFLFRGRERANGREDCYKLCTDRKRTDLAANLRRIDRIVAAAQGQEPTRCMLIADLARPGCLGTISIEILRGHTRIFQAQIQ